MILALAYDIIFSAITRNWDRVWTFSLGYQDYVQKREYKSFSYAHQYGQSENGTLGQ